MKIEIIGKTYDATVSTVHSGRRTKPVLTLQNASDVICMDGGDTFCFEDVQPLQPGDVRDLGAELVKADKAERAALRRGGYQLAAASR